MTKVTYTMIKMPPELKSEVKNISKSRGMTLSGYIKYLISRDIDSHKPIVQ